MLSFYTQNVVKMILMVYEDFIQMINRAKKNDSRDASVDTEAFPLYLEQVDMYLDSYFQENNTKRNYEILKARAQGYTLEELGEKYGGVTRERMRQIIGSVLAKLRSPSIVQGNKHLRNLFSFLCGIGEVDIMGFIYYLFPKKHVLLLIISDDLFNKSIRFEKELRDVEVKAKRKKEMKKPFSSNEEIKEAIRKYFRYNQAASFNEIADTIMSNTNFYHFTGRVTWNKIMDVLFEMREEGEITRVYGKLTIK